MPICHITSAVTRRCCLAMLAAASLALSTAHAAPPTVDIIGFAHPPVQTALKPLRNWLATQGTKVNVTETDMDSPAAAQRLKALGLNGHIPVVVLVNGQFRHTLPGGKVVELVGFPTGGSMPAGAKGGGWTTDDVKAILAI